MDKEVVDRIVSHIRGALTPAQVQEVAKALMKADDGWCIVVRGAKL